MRLNNSSEFPVMKQTDPRGKTRHAYIHVGPGAAVPGAHGLSTGTGLPTVKCIVHFCSVI